MHTTTPPDCSYSLPDCLSPDCAHTHAQTADHQTAHTRLLHSYINIKFIIARLLLCQTALARLLLCQTAVFWGLYAPRLPIFLCFCQTAAVWEIGQSGNLKRVVGYDTCNLHGVPAAGCAPLSVYGELLLFVYILVCMTLHDSCS